MHVLQDDLFVGTELWSVDFGRSSSCLVSVQHMLPTKKRRYKKSARPQKICKLLDIG